MSVKLTWKDPYGAEEKRRRVYVMFGEGFIDVIRDLACFAARRP